MKLLTRTKLSTAAIALGIATTFALLFTAERYLSVKDLHVISRHFFWELIGWCVWAALLPVIFSVVRNNPIGRSHWIKILFVHLIAGIILALFQFEIQDVVGKYVVHYDPKDPFIPVLSWKVVAYFQIVVVCYTIEF